MTGLEVMGIFFCVILGGGVLYYFIWLTISVFGIKNLEVRISYLEQKERMEVVEEFRKGFKKPNKRKIK